MSVIVRPYSAVVLVPGNASPSARYAVTRATSSATRAWINASLNPMLESA